MTPAAVALGSNLGDRRTNLRRAVAGLAELGDVVSVSGLYETAPVGGPEQGPYLNAAVLVDTDLPAGEFLAGLHRLEEAAGRVRRERWEPRVLDLDLILYGESVIEPDATGGLAVPHPRYLQRRFVLEPLLDAWPDAVDPTGVHLVEALAAVAGQEVARVADAAWSGEAAASERVAAPDRGGRWVAAQTVVLAVILGAILVGRGALTGATVRSLGVLIGLGGAALAAGGGLRLGRNLTPYPEPVAGGHLVTTGVYGLVRHPLYGATVLVAAGASLWAGSVLGFVASVLAIGFYVAKARVEEERLVVVYPGYAAYRQRVRRRLIPWLI